jgi:ribosomal protein S18 acetylase RimI-like enzyme
MHPAPRRPLPGIVFRRLRSPSERSAASGLLADSGVPPAAIRSAGNTVLYGLWDLAAHPGEGLVAVAATRPLDDAGSLQLCGIAVRVGLRRRGLGRRLLTEVADALRADGAERLLVRSADAQSPAAALLARAGFATTDGEVGWCYLEL